MSTMSRTDLSQQGPSTDGRPPENQDSFADLIESYQFSSYLTDLSLRNNETGEELILDPQNIDQTSSVRIKNAKSLNYTNIADKLLKKGPSWTEEAPKLLRFNDLDIYLEPIDQNIWKIVTSTKTSQRKFIHNKSNAVSIRDPRTISLKEEHDLPENWKFSGISNGKGFYRNDVLKKTSWNPWIDEKVLNRFPIAYSLVNNLTFAEKLKILKDHINLNLVKSDVASNRNLDIVVSRKYLFRSAFNFFMQDQQVNVPGATRTSSGHKKYLSLEATSNFRKNLKICFINEPGLDFGGVSREFFLLLSKQLGDPNFGLFSTTPDYNLTVNPQSEFLQGPAHLSYFKFIGRIIGIAIFHRRLLDLNFSPLFYKTLLQKNIVLDDISSIDSEFHQHLSWILETEKIGSDFDLGLTFSINEQVFGMTKVRTIDLIPNGANIEVTDQNKEEYVKLLINYKFSTSIQNQIHMINDGISDIIPLEWLRLFNEKELELLLCGNKQLDIRDWKKFTNYRDCTYKDKTIKHFWRWLDNASNEKRKTFLQFVTGTNRVPNGGFKNLVGNDGPKKFNIWKTGSTSKLPVAHTCFNRLDLPDYKNYNKLKYKLDQALAEGHIGFGIQ